MAKNYKEVADFLGNVRFRYKLIGGVDEEDVWRVFEQLHNEYDELLDVQQQYSLGAIGEWRDYALQLQDLIRANDEEVKRLREEWNQLKDVMKKESSRPIERVGQPVLRQDSMLAQKRGAIQSRQGVYIPKTAQTPAACSANQLLVMYGGKSASNE